MIRRLLYTFSCSIFIAFIFLSPAQALRKVPIDEARLAQSNSIKRAYRVRRTAKGLSYRRRVRRRMPRAVRAARARAAAYEVVFRNAGDRVRLGRALIYHIVIDRRLIRKKPGLVDGYTPAFHIARLSAGPHSVKLSVIDRRTRRRYAVYWGQILVSGGSRLSLTLTSCRVAARCRATLREGGRILFGRP